MRPSTTNFYILIIVLCTYFFSSCTHNNTSVKKSKTSVIKDSVFSLYNQAKNRKLSIPERLQLVNDACELSKQHDSIYLIDIYSLKNAIYSDANLTDSTLLYANLMLGLAAKIQDTEKIGKAYFKLADYHKSQSRYDSAYYYFNLSKERYLSIKDSSQVGKKLMAMARILLDDDDYYASETTCIEALRYLSLSKDKKYIASVYHILSMASRKQFNHHKALEQIDRALELNKSAKDEILYINSKLLTLRENQEYNKVITIYDSVLTNELITKNKREYARIIDNLAYTQWLANSSSEVEIKFFEAYEIRKSTNDIQGLLASYSHLMKYFAKKDKSKSLKYANKLYSLSVEQKNTEDRLEALFYLKKLSSATEYIKYDRLYDKLYDSINKTRTLARNKYAAIRYDATKDREKALLFETQNKEKDLQLTKETSRRNILLLISATLIIITISVFLIWKQRIKTARLQERHITNTRLSKKLHDEVGNDLYYLLLQLQKVSGFKSDHENLKILKGFDNVYHKIRDFSRDTKVETGEEYGDELLSLLDSYGDDETKIITSELAAGFWTSVSPHKKEELYLVLKELLTNMKRHSKADIVAITFAKEKRKIKVNYTDNGVGMNLEKLVSKNGLHNVENRIKDINGSITFDSKPEEGFKATIVFTP